MVQYSSHYSSCCAGGCYPYDVIQCGIRSLVPIPIRCGLGTRPWCQLTGLWRHLGSSCTHDGQVFGWQHWGQFQAASRPPEEPGKTKGPTEGPGQPKFNCLPIKAVCKKCICVEGKVFTLYTDTCTIIGATFTNYCLRCGINKCFPVNVLVSWSQTLAPCNYKRLALSLDDIWGQNYV